MTTVAVRLPNTLGEKHTLNDTLQPGAINAEYGCVVTWKSPAESPAIWIDGFPVNWSIADPGFEIVKVRTRDWPDTTVPNCELPETPIAGANPVPVRANWYDPAFAALLAMDTAAVRLPALWGEKVTLNFTLPPGGTVAEEGCVTR